MTPIEYAASLRQIAGWYEAHPGMPVPSDPTLRISAPDTPEDVARLARELAPCEKTIGHDTNLFVLRRVFGTITLELLFWRSTVCTRRVVGTVSVPEVVIAAHSKDLVEWDCPDSVLSHDPV